MVYTTIDCAVAEDCAVAQSVPENPPAAQSVPENQPAALDFESMTMEELQMLNLIRTMQRLRKEEAERLRKEAEEAERLRKEAEEAEILRLRLGEDGERIECELYEI